MVAFNIEDSAAVDFGRGVESVVFLCFFVYHKIWRSVSFKTKVQLIIVSRYKSISSRVPLPKKYRKKIRSTYTQVTRYTLIKIID